MASLVHGHSWISTPVGPIENWPQSFKTIVDLLLACDFPTVLLWGPGLIQVYNDGYREIMGNKHPAGLGQSTQECWPEVWQFNEPIYARVRQGETVTFTDQLFPIERRGCRENAWFTLCYSPVRGEAGEIAGVLVTVFETTQQRQAEQAQNFSEERFRALVMASSYSVYAMSPDWSEMKMLDGNGFLSDTDTPTRAWLEEYILPEDRARVMTAIQQAIQNTSLFELEHRVRRADGTTGWTLSRAVPLLDENGSVREWFGAASNISDRKAVETKRQQLQTELERSNGELSVFSHIVAHDLQSPLRMITIYSQLLEKQQLNAVSTQFLETISNGAGQMERLIQGLLHYAQAGQDAADESLVSMDNILVLALQNVTSENQDEEVQVEHTPLPEIWGDEAKLLQLFQNLISNGIKYRRADVSIHIEISAKRHSGEWLFAVKDNGEGIALAYQKQIFEPLKRLHGKEVPGTGIGLAICRRIVQQSGGKIWVKSEPGQGSTFYFTLPASN